MRYLRWLFIALFILVVCLGLAIRLRAIQQTDLKSASGFPLLDDAFYYFSLGRNLAAGHGPFVDSLHITTGFQPLWGFIVALPYLILPEAQAIMGVQLLGVLIGLLTFVAIYFFTEQVTRSSIAGLINAGLWFLMPLAVKENINGMETGLATLMIVMLLWCFYNLYAHPSRRALIVLGLVCGIAPLARSELAILSAGILLFILIVPPQKGTLSTRIGTVLTAGSCAVLALLPWVLFTLSVGKSPIPESGEAMRILSFYFSTRPISADLKDRIAYGREMLSQLLATYQGADYAVLPLTLGRMTLQRLEWVVYVVVAILVVIRRNRLWRLVVVYGLGVVGMLLAYSLLVPAVWYFDRYVEPWAEGLNILLVLIALDFVLSRHIESRRVIAALACAAFVYGMLMFFTTGYDLYRRQLDSIVLPPSPNNVDPLYAVTEWFNEHLAPGERAATFQTGLVSYYARVPVINLDGVVNHAATQAIVQGQMWEYLCSEDINYVADAPNIIEYLMDNVVAPERLKDGSFIPIKTFPVTIPVVQEQVDAYKVNRDHCAAPTS